MGDRKHGFIWDGTVERTRACASHVLGVDQRIRSSSSRGRMNRVQIMHAECALNRIPRQNLFATCRDGRRGRDGGRGGCYR